MLAVGEYLLGYVDDWVQRMTTGLAGGVGGSHQEMCGALSGGVLLIGAMHGRTRSDEDDSQCRKLAVEFLAWAKALPSPMQVSAIPKGCLVRHRGCPPAHRT